jgi:hypothetical protein
VRAVLRPTLAATSLVILYFVLPLGERFAGVTAVLLVAGLLGVAGLVMWQARAIARADHPRLRAIEALATSVPLFVLLFAAAYYLMGTSRPGSFSEPLTRTDALYFTITVFATVGFGDIVPRSEPARVLTMVQMVGDLLVLGLAARYLLGAVQVGLRRQSASGPTSPTKPPAGADGAGHPDDARSAP